jgi:hypothetical protein
VDARSIDVVADDHINRGKQDGIGGHAVVTDDGLVQDDNGERLDRGSVAGLDENCRVATTWKAHASRDRVGERIVGTLRDAGAEFPLEAGEPSPVRRLTRPAWACFLRSVIGTVREFRVRELDGQAR